jgi:hypothetical protein
MHEDIYGLRHLLVAVRDYGPDLSDRWWLSENPYHPEEDLGRAEDAGLVELDQSRPGAWLTQEGEKSVEGYRSYAGGCGIQAIPFGSEIA